MTQTLRNRALFLYVLAINNFGITLVLVAFAVAIGVEKAAISALVFLGVIIDLVKIWVSGNAINDHEYVVSFLVLCRDNEVAGNDNKRRTDIFDNRYAGSLFIGSALIGAIGFFGIENDSAFIRGLLLQVNAGLDRVLYRRVEIFNDIDGMEGLEFASIIKLIVIHNLFVSIAACLFFLFRNLQIEKAGRTAFVNRISVNMDEFKNDTDKRHNIGFANIMCIPISVVIMIGTDSMLPDVLGGVLESQGSPMLQVVHILLIPMMFGGIAIVFFMYFTTATILFARNVATQRKNATEG